MAALGHMQIPLKLVRLRLGLPFIRPFFFPLLRVFWLFNFFFFIFIFQKQRSEIGLLKGRVAKTLGYLGIRRSALLNASFCFNGVSLGDID